MCVNECFACVCVYLINRIKEAKISQGRQEVKRNIIRAAGGESPVSSPSSASTAIFHRRLASRTDF